MVRNYILISVSIAVGISLTYIPVGPVASAITGAVLRGIR